MKFIDKRLNEEIEIIELKEINPSLHDPLVIIYMKGIKTYPWCKMKKSQCMEAWRYKCANYMELERVNKYEN
jgi:glutaredoxin-related protein